MSTVLEPTHTDRETAPPIIHIGLYGTDKALCGARFPQEESIRTPLHAVDCVVCLNMAATMQLRYHPLQP